MKNGKKIAVGVLVSLLAVFILLIAAILIVPRFIDRGAVGDKVRSEVSKLVGGEFDFERVDLALFPAPHVLLADPKLVLAQRLTAAAQAIEIYPEILPLFTGKINLKHARLRQPDLVITLPKAKPGDQAPAKPLAVGDLLRSVATAMAGLPELNLPAVNGRITKGRVKLVYDNTTTFELHDLEADLQSGSDKVTFQITAASDILDSLSISGWTNLRQIKSSARIVLKNLRPGRCL